VYHRTEVFSIFQGRIAVFTAFEKLSDPRVARTRANHSRGNQYSVSLSTKVLERFLRGFTAKQDAIGLR
jgi:hypothetical protein